MSACIELDLVLVHETDDAWLVDDGTGQVWLPKSRCEFDGRSNFTVPLWLAEEKGLC